MLTKTLVVFINILLILFMFGCEFFNSEDLVIEFISYESDFIKSGINGIKVNVTLHPSRIENLKDNYILAMFFFYNDKTQIKSTEVKEVLKKTYIKDLFFSASGQGNLAYYREIKFKNLKKTNYEFFIPYIILPFYESYLISKQKERFYIRIDLFYEGKRQLESNFLEINLE